MSNLYQSSIQIILENQAESGAYIASPAFPQYAYSWLRDGSFIAYAMDRVGEYASAAAFFRWVHHTLQRFAWKVEHVLSSAPDALNQNDYLHTRYTLSGEEARGAWENFQLDGYGTWLWALREHVERSGDIELCDEVAPSIELTVRYLSALWQRPNYDYWEEFADKVHLSTLAALYAGLSSAQALRSDNARRTELPAAIREFILSGGVHQGHFVKYLGTDALDAGLVALSTPFRVFDPEDPLMRSTVERIERDLVHASGTHRYLRDTYYGGGEWILLSAWLGWYQAERGERARAERYLSWVEAQADAEGNLPEQVSTHLLFPDRLAEWEARWGPIARPLLWSHAMYLILFQVLEKRTGG